MIPKVIHYCWFGGKELPEKVNWYISTWRKYCPNYKIIEWNESNFDVNQNLYCKEAYEAKKWAFVSDYARLKILYEHGGIYMDTDVEVCKSFDNLLCYEFFACYEKDKISIGTFGCKSNDEYVKTLLKLYEGISFTKEDGSFDQTTNVERITNQTLKSFQIRKKENYDYIMKNHVIFPEEFFIAKDFFTGRIMKTGNTYAVHHYDSSWLNKKERNKIALRRILTEMFGTKSVDSILKFKNYIRSILCAK